MGYCKHWVRNLRQHDYAAGVAHAGNRGNAQRILHWERSATHSGDFQQMQVHSISDTTYWSGQALISLGRNDEAKEVFQKIFDYSLELELQTPKIDYFATSLPTMLLFEEDLVLRQKISAKFLRAQP